MGISVTGNRSFRSDRIDCLSVYKISQLEPDEGQDPVPAMASTFDVYCYSTHRE